MVFCVVGFFFFTQVSQQALWAANRVICFRIIRAVPPTSHGEEREQSHMLNSFNTGETEGSLFYSTSCNVPILQENS